MTNPSSSRSALKNIWLISSSDKFSPKSFATFFNSKLVILPWINYKLQLCSHRMKTKLYRFQLGYLCRSSWRWQVSRILRTQFLLIDRHRAQPRSDKRTCCLLGSRAVRKLSLVLVDQQLHWDHHQRYRKQSWYLWLLRRGWSYWRNLLPSKLSFLGL